MNSAIRILSGAFLCAVTAIGCDSGRPSDFVTQGDTGADTVADSDSDTEIAADTLTDSGTATADGLNGVYFNDILLTEKALERRDSAIDFDWGEDSPGPGINRDSFSVRWTGSIKPKFSENYTFTTASDDGVRLWVDNKLIINNWSEHSLEEDSGTIELKTGKLHSIKLEYFDNTEDAVIKLYWSSSSQSEEIIPVSALFKAYDECPDDPHKILAGECGCGEKEGSCGVADGALWMVTFDHKHSGHLYVFPNGETMMIDTGHKDGPEKVISFLRYHGINHIDYLQLTHNHGDHTGGVEPLTKAGFITDKTHVEGCLDFEVGERFERAGTSWYIYNADRGGRCDENEDSIAYWMWYKNFRFSGGGDEATDGKEELVNNTSLDLDEFFPVDVRYEQRGGAGGWYDPFEELLNAQFYICPHAAPETLARLNSGSRVVEVVKEPKIHVIRVLSAEEYDTFYCDRIEDCPVDFDIPR